MDSSQPRKFGTGDRDYDLFEEFPDGSIIWRACIFGLEQAELHLRELARESTNKFYAVCLQDHSTPLVIPGRTNELLTRKSRRCA
jgi:hypothetical protein